MPVSYCLRLRYYAHGLIPRCCAVALFQYLRLIRLRLPFRSRITGLRALFGLRYAFDYRLRLPRFTFYTDYDFVDCRCARFTAHVTHLHTFDWTPVTRLRFVTFWRSWLRFAFATVTDFWVTHFPVYSARLRFDYVCRLVPRAVFCLRYRLFLVTRLRLRTVCVFVTGWLRLFGCVCVYGYTARSTRLFAGCVTQLPVAFWFVLIRWLRTFAFCTFDWLRCVTPVRWFTQFVHPLCPDVLHVWILLLQFLRFTTRCGLLHAFPVVRFYVTAGCVPFCRFRVMLLRVLVLRGLRLHVRGFVVYVPTAFTVDCYTRYARALLIYHISVTFTLHALFTRWFDFAVPHCCSLLIVTLRFAFCSWLLLLLFLVVLHARCCHGCHLRVTPRLLFVPALRYLLLRLRSARFPFAAFTFYALPWLRCVLPFCALFTLRLLRFVWNCFATLVVRLRTHGCCYALHFAPLRYVHTRFWLHALRLCTPFYRWFVHGYVDYRLRDAHRLLILRYAHFGLRCVPLHARTCR